MNQASAIALNRIMISYKAPYFHDFKRYSSIFKDMVECRLVGVTQTSPFNRIIKSKVRMKLMNPKRFLTASQRDDYAIVQVVASGAS